MALPEYVFCMWNDLLWPAKVLPRHEQLSPNCSLSVELLVLKKKVHVSLIDTKPFLMAELQKIRDVLEQTKKPIITSDERIHQRALDLAADKIRSSSESLSTDTLKKRACEQKVQSVLIGYRKKLACEQKEESVIIDALKKRACEQKEESLIIGALRKRACEQKEESLSTSTLRKRACEQKEESLSTSTLKKRACEQKERIVDKKGSTNKKRSSSLSESLSTDTLKKRACEQKEESLSTSTLTKRACEQKEESLSTSTLKKRACEQKEESLSTSTLKKQACEQKERIVDKKGSTNKKRSSLSESLSTDTECTDTESLSTGTLKKRACEQKEESLSTGTLKKRACEQKEESLSTSTLKKQACKQKERIVDKKGSTNKKRSSSLSESLSTDTESLSTGTLKKRACEQKEESLSTGTLKKRACEQKETTVDKKGSQSFRPNTKQNKTKERTKGNGEGSKKKQNNSGAAISNEALETDSDSGIVSRKPSTAQTTQKNKKRQLNKRQDKDLCGEKTVCDDTVERKSKKDVGSVGKSKGSLSTCKDLVSPTVSPTKKGHKGTVQRPVQCRLRLSRKRFQETSTYLQAESSETDNENGNGHSVDKYLKLHMPDFEEEKGLSSSELSMEMSSPECTAFHAVSSSQDDTEEDVQLPVVVLQKEPAGLIPGSFAWCKFQHYPYWPSLVKLVDSKHKRATIIFLEESISDATKKKKRFKVPLRSLKHYDCPDKQQLLEKARKDFGKSIDWCDSLISDYRIRLGCGSFCGSFMDYCTAAISLPVRRELENGKREILFPVIGSEVPEDKQEEPSDKSQTKRKLLPDRSRAARDRANKKLVAFIVNSEEAEKHLLDILVGKKKSRWLKKFQLSNRRMNCLETYIEDEEQIEVVVGYLQTVCEKKRGATEQLMLGDQTRFIFEVLIPEAVIFAISATEQISYEEAEKKYLQGPSVTKRERKVFEEQILEEKRIKLSLETKIKKDKKK